MTTTQQKAFDLHAGGSNCAQSVVCALAPSIGLDTVTAHRMATCLGAGFGRKQLVCGAVSGAALALGAALGTDSGADGVGKEKCYALISRFVEQFELQLGASDCRHLLGVDLGSEEGRAEFKAKGLGRSVCDRAITTAIALAEETIAAAKRDGM